MAHLAGRDTRGSVVIVHFHWFTGDGDAAWFSSDWIQLQARLAGVGPSYGRVELNPSSAKGDLSEVGISFPPIQLIPDLAAMGSGWRGWGRIKAPALF